MSAMTTWLCPWGPVIEQHTRLRSERAVEVIAEQACLPLDAFANMFINCALRHRYVVLDHIAETRRSIVLRAVDLLICRVVAIKVHRDDGEETIRHALFEARAIAQVGLHRNVVRVLDVGDYEGHLYTVMELCDSDLATWVVDKPWFETVDRILEAGAGLQALHTAGLVHADVKPANILVNGGTAQIADLGLCGPAGRVFRISGTPGYIAPEAAAGLRVEAGDVFGLACTAWSCLLGVEPFGAAPIRADVSSAVLVLVERARSGELELPAKLPKGLPRRLLGVLRAGLHADPQRRPDLGSWLRALSKARTRSVWTRLG